MIFGNRDQFAIEVELSAAQSTANSLWGDMCVIIRNARLGHFGDYACSLEESIASFKALLDGLSDLWLPKEAPEEPSELYRFLREKLYGEGEDDHRYWRFDFLTNWGEQFDGFVPCFIVLASGASVRIIHPADDNQIEESLVDLNTFVSATEAFLQWCGQQRRTIETEKRDATH